MSQSKSVMHFSTQNVQSPARPGGSTNVGSATHQTIDSWRAPKQTRMPAGLVGPANAFHPLSLPTGHIKPTYPIWCNHIAILWFIGLTNYLGRCSPTPPTLTHHRNFQQALSHLCPNTNP